MQLNDVTRMLLSLMQEKPEMTGRQLLELTAVRIGHLTPSAVIGHGAQLLHDLRIRDVLLGMQPEAGSS